jgi:ADP-ribose pyrophosphatase YjhB (NUDIX family)
MDKLRYMTRSAVYLILLKNDKILLSKRQNTAWMDGFYSLVSGHVEADETISEAMVRETKEEINISLEKSNLIPATVIHRKSDQVYYDFFFVCHKWQGDITNAEPNYCSELTWFGLNALPENTLPYIKEAIKQYQEKIAFSEYGWS